MVLAPQQATLGLDHNVWQLLCLRMRFADVISLSMTCRFLYAKVEGGEKTESRIPRFQELLPDLQLFSRGSDTDSFIHAGQFELDFLLE